MNAQTLKEVLAEISGLMDQHRDYLVELDQQNGDGDLGISMSAGYKAAAHYLADTGEKDLGKLLMNCGSTFNEAAPSSLGTITSIGFFGMAKALKGKETADLGEIAAALEAGIKAVMEKAKSAPGEKTILDALCPALEALKNAAGNAGAGEAFKAAAIAAAEGSERTKIMKSVHGRAAYYGDKSIGILDGGSVVGKLIFEGISAYLNRPA
jgi:dihydroxyacetone kinase-like protein